MSLEPGFDDARDRAAGAADERDLSDALQLGRAAVIAAVSAHAPATRLATSWSALVRATVTAAARIVTAAAPIDWDFQVSGSTGRGEALPGSDIDSLLVLADTESGRLREATDRAAEVHALLERLGLHGDDKGALASRNRFCRTEREWLAGIETWTADPRADRGVVMTGLLADAVSAADPDAASPLRAGIAAAVQRQPDSRRLMLQDATAQRAGIPGRLRVFATGDDVIDLKSAALEPLVAIARWASLSVGSTDVSTIDRLHAAAGTERLSEADSQTLRECYAILTRLRWRYRAKDWIEGRGGDDRVALSSMSPQDRATLRALGGEVAGVRRKLAYLSTTAAFG
ncbi:putative nucleotidyltransferase substrate binding domain-containing protein [Aldersonia kunmingensis]|uniref:putative nucleotidyltransferase substrate binding domain-containing protein n=1 Tax=Aldersonia kunmingensis TaxID=408066 RepID=UPI0008333AF7|nr:putative nucleotidyltransferase substrate binding domain-containing protein [Aldersonia kunmingensis]